MQTKRLSRKIFQQVNLGLQRKLNRVGTRTLLYRAQPELFFKEKLGTRLWGGAQDAVNALAAKPNARVSVVAGHGTQKTFSAANAALWFSYCWRPSKVITTAPTGKQVEKLLWSDIRKTFRKAKILDPDYPGRILTKEWKGSPDWFMFGFSSDEPMNAEGFHGDNVLLIIDEAKAVEDEMYEALEGCLSGANARLLLISTAGNPEGEFFESQVDPLFKPFCFSCEDMVRWYEEQDLDPPPGCTTRRWIDERLQKWGIDSQRFKMRVLAQFCESIADAIVPFEWVQRALKNKIKRGGKIRIGADIAEFGDDLTVLFVGDDFGDIEIDVSEKQEPTATAGKIIRLIKKYKVKEDDVKVDTTGIGSGVGSMLREKGYDVDCVHFAEASSDDEEYADIITEMYWGLRRMFERPDFHISNEPLLIGDITKRKYITDSNGAFKIEPKKLFKKREKRSSDYGDAAALCYFDNSLRLVGAAEKI